jgi:hypothetical protein
MSRRLVDCGYASHDDFCCTRPKGHKGKHRFTVEWETDPWDIPHEHIWVEPTKPMLVVYGQEGPEKVCEFCGKWQTQPTAKNYNDYIAYALLSRLTPALEMKDENSI